jgi:hypothetical protein
MQRRRSRMALEHAAAEARWKKRDTARLLGISRPTLYAWIKAVGLEWPARNVRNARRVNETAECKGQFSRTLAPPSSKPRFGRMSTSPVMDDEQELRPFQTKLHMDIIDDVRHLAIDKRIPVWQVVEEALREKVARERSESRR